MPKKKLTERQAWLRLAELWDKPQQNESNECFIQTAYGRPYGLCASMDCLDIPPKVDNAMMAKIGKLPNKLGDFKWGLGKAGAKARAKFCRKQAAMLERKRPSRAK